MADTIALGACPTCGGPAQFVGGAEVLHAAARSEWQPIATAPKDGSHVMLYRPHIQFIGYYSTVCWRVNAPGLPAIDPPPTHWQSLPAPPEPFGAREEVDDGNG